MAADSRWIILHLIIFLVLVQATQGDEQEYRLTRYLLSNYDASVRPADNNSLPLKVTFGISLHHIIDVDEKNQILTTNCWLTSIWTDHHLKWNASDFAGIKVVRIPYNRVWRPDVILYNNADAQYSAAVINTNVIVSSSGEVVWLSHGIYRSSCDINVEYFPFDVQSCQMKWASWTYDGYQLVIAILTIAIAFAEAGYHGWSGGGGGGGDHGGGGGGHGGGGHGGGGGGGHGGGGHGGGGGGHGGGGKSGGGGGYGGGGHGVGGGHGGGGGGGHGGSGGGGHGGGGHGGGGSGGHGGGGHGGGGHGGSGGGGHGGSGGGGHGGGGGGGHGGGGGGGGHGGGGKKCYCYC